jgi:hypothetical protein
MDRSLVDQASKILKAEFDPSKFLLTHATIVASVDTIPGPSTRLGAVTEDGKKIVRKTANYRIKSGCDRYANNNLDAWARSVLLKSYKTFIGANSFVEHVQIQEMSKGRIIDAVARDIGDSVYVDILIANDRKHASLIKDIESGKLSTLSMGCSIDGSTCTKCGHWAADETEFCDHVRHEKGNTFYGEDGQKYRVAELCGDESLDPTGGVTFIEASWVETPAFTGAVARNVLTVDSKSEKKAAKRIQTVFESPSPQVNPAAMKKAAFDLSADMFDEEPETPNELPVEKPEAPAETPSDETPAAPATKEPSALSGIQDDLKKFVLDSVQDQLKSELEKSKIRDQAGLPSSDAPNDTVVKQARVQRRAGMKRAYSASLREILATSGTDADLMNRVATLNMEIGIQVPVSVYRGALKVGARNSYRDVNLFLRAASKALGHQPTPNEARTMIRLASLLEAHRYTRRHADQNRSKENLK